jgi:hypothetical protein
VKVYLDENLPPFVTEPLALIYREHSFVSWSSEGLQGTEDVPLMKQLRSRGFNAIITRDRAQLKDPLERRAVAESGLKWIGVADKKLSGLEYVAITVATLAAGLRFAFDHVATGPTSYSLVTVPHMQLQRIKIREIASF